MGANGEEPHRFVPADEGYFLLSLAWFPDSSRLGYLRRGHAEKRSDISILSRDLEESRSGVVFADPKLVAFCIASDGRMLVSLADSPSFPRGFDLWEIRTDPRTGQANSAPHRLSNWAGSALVDLSVTADGKRLVYLEGTAQYDAYTAELEESGLKLKAPQRLTLDDSLDFPGAWSPDSREVFFGTDRNGNFDIFKQAINQRIANAVLTSREDEVEPTVSPDGAWILYFNQSVFRRINSTEPITLRRLPFSGGPSQVVFKEPRVCCLDCNGSKAKNRLCVVDKRVGDELIFYAVDPVHGLGRELLRVQDPKNVHFWRVSPDGLNISMVTAEKGGSIRILSLTGKPTRDIVVNQPVDHVYWSSDGKGFYSTTVDTNAVPWAVAGGSHQKLLHIDLEGRTKTMWQFGNFSGVYMLPSPDGRYLALGMGRMVANAWMVENF